MHFTNNLKNIPVFHYFRGSARQPRSSKSPNPETRRSSLRSLYCTKRAYITFNHAAKRAFRNPQIPRPGVAHCVRFIAPKVLISPSITLVSVLSGIHTLPPQPRAQTRTHFIRSIAPRVLVSPSITLVSVQGPLVSHTSIAVPEET